MLSPFSLLREKRKSERGEEERKREIGEEERKRGREEERKRKRKRGRERGREEEKKRSRNENIKKISVHEMNHFCVKSRHLEKNCVVIILFADSTKLLSPKHIHYWE
jgi:hypothetical protein